MKILKPRISILMISICFFIGSTEILNALHFDAKAPDAVEQNGKDAPGKGSTPKAPGKAPVPDEARVSNSTTNHTTSVANPIHTDSPTTSPQTGIKLSDNTSTDQNTTQPKSKKSVRFEEQPAGDAESAPTNISRPSTPIDNSANGQIKTTVQGNKAATQSSGIQLGEGKVTEIQTPTSGDKNQQNQSLFKTGEKDGTTSKDTPSVDALTPVENHLFNQDAAPADAENSQSVSTEPLNSHDSEVSDTDTTTPVKNQLLKEESAPADAKATNEEIKPDNSAGKSDPKQSDLNAKKQEKMSTISKTLEALSKLIESFTRTFNQDPNLTKPERDALKTNVNKAKSSLTDAMKQLEQIKSDKDMTADDKNKATTEIETNIKNIKDTLADTIAGTKTGSTIHNDLLKSLDDLDPVTKEEVVNMQKTIRDDLATLKSAFKDFKSNRGLSLPTFDTYGYAWYEFLEKTKNVKPETLENFKNANQSIFKTMITNQEFQNNRVHLDPTRKDNYAGYIDSDTGNYMSRKDYNQLRINELELDPKYKEFMKSSFVDTKANAKTTNPIYTDPNYNRLTGKIDSKTLPTKK